MLLGHSKTLVNTHTHPTENIWQKLASNADHIGLMNKYERRLLENPYANPRPSRIIWGSGNDEYTRIYEGFNKSYPSITRSQKGKYFWQDENGQRRVILREE